MARQVFVQVSEDAAGAEWDEQALAVLRTELDGLGVGAVALARGAGARPGTRAPDIAEAVGLVVSIAQVPDALRQMVTTVTGWLGRDYAHRTARLVLGGNELEVTGISSQTQERLIDAWISACTAPAGPGSRDHG